MADTALSALTALTTPASGDFVEVLDISDTTTMGTATGTNKKITYANFFTTAIGTTVQAWDADLDAFAGLTSGTNTFPYYTGTNTMGTTAFVPWTTWSPTFSGWSGNPQGGIYRYTQVGKMVSCQIAQPNVGTSNAASKQISLPLTAATTCQMITPVIAIDAGTTCLVGTCGAIGVSGTAIAFHKGWGGLNGWTTSGTCRFSFCNFTYEAA